MSFPSGKAFKGEITDWAFVHDVRNGALHVVGIVGNHAVFTTALQNGMVGEGEDIETRNSRFKIVGSSCPFGAHDLIGGLVEIGSLPANIAGGMIVVAPNESVQKFADGRKKHLPMESWSFQGHADSNDVVACGFIDKTELHKSSRCPDEVSINYMNTSRVLIVCGDGVVTQNSVYPIEGAPYDLNSDHGSPGRDRAISRGYTNDVTEVFSSMLKVDGADASEPFAEHSGQTNPSDP